MTTLEQIKKAYGMNYGAVIRIGDTYYLVVSITDELFALRADDGDIIFTDSVIKDDYEITGYKYLGELGGNQKIEEGQIFRVKKTGEIGESIVNKYAPHYEVWLGETGRKYFHKSEIEPVF